MILYVFHFLPKLIYSKASLQMDTKAFGIHFAKFENKIIFTFKLKTHNKSSRENN